MANLIQDNKGFRIELENQKPVYLKDENGNITLDRFPWIARFLAVNLVEKGYEVLYRFTNGKLAKWSIDEAGYHLGFTSLDRKSISDIAAEFGLDEVKLSVDNFSSNYRGSRNISNTLLKKKPVQLTDKVPHITEKIFDNFDTKNPHRSGSLSRKVLEAIELLIPENLNFSVETGCGRSTILLSNKSQKHLVFCLDDRGEQGSSVNFVKQSSLFITQVTDFIFGCTQQTLPTYKFNRSIDLAIIDGPHGYPFPDLEYFFIYPYLKKDALLVIDDLQIPNIGNMFDILLEDEMFEFLGIVQSTGFLRRTAAPTQDPYGDGWQYQNYNARKINERIYHFFNNVEDIQKIDLPLIVNFTAMDGNFTSFTGVGWSMPEESGIFTIGSKSTILFELKPNTLETVDNIEIKINLSGLLHPQHKKQVASLSINGVYTSSFTFENEDFVEWTSKVSKELFLQSCCIELSLNVSHPFIRGKTQDWRKNDWRRLGLLVKAIDINVE